MTICMCDKRTVVLILMQTSAKDSYFYCLTSKLKYRAAGHLFFVLVFSFIYFQTSSVLEKDAEMRVLLYSFLAAEGSEFSQEVRPRT